MIVNGECDALPEQAFYMVGTIDEAFEKGQVAAVMRDGRRAARRAAGARRPQPGRAMSTIKVDVVSARSRSSKGEAEFVALPGEAGELGIYPQHTPLITRVRPGAVRIRSSAVPTRSSSSWPAASSRCSRTA